MLLVVLLSPSIGLAADLPLQVNGVQVTDDNASDILDDGTASYDAPSNTLTLNGAEITKSTDMISAPGIASSEELTIVLVGTNSINMTSSSASANGITTQKGLTIEGSGTLDITAKGNGIWNTSGALTISGVTLDVDTTSGESAAIKSDGTIAVDQGALLTLESAGQEPAMRSDPNTGSDNGWISITNSTVDITCDEGDGLLADYDITLTSSDVDITNAWNGIYSWNQNVVISGGTLDVITTSTECNGIYAYETVRTSGGADVSIESSGYPAIYGYNIELTDSTVEAAAGNDAAIYCDETLRVERCVVQATSGSDEYAGLSSGSSVIIDGSWIESSSELTTLGAYKNSVIIEGNAGKTTGDLVLPASVTLPQGTTLTVREGTSITVPEGCTLTNNGIIELYGDFVVEGGTGVCASNNHVGGTATCCEKAVCAVCGSEYGEPDTAHHTALERVTAVPATCTTAGTAEHWACDGCGKLFSDEDGIVATTAEELVLPALNHDWSEWAETIAPTCVSDGKEVRECSRCDASETRTVARLGHELTRVAAVAPTCTEAGTAEHWACSRCGALFSDAAGAKPATADDLVIAATGHGFEDGVCTACGAEDPDYVGPEKKPEPKPEESPTDEADKPEIPATGDPASVVPALLGMGAALVGAATWERRRAS